MRTFKRVSYKRLLAAIALGLGLSLGLGSSVQAGPFATPDQRLFEQSRLTALRGQWGAAAEGFNALLARAPDGPLADDSYFWVGSCYTEMERYSEAARAYRELLSHFPDSPFRPEASLRLARLLEGPLDDDRAAEQVYRDIPPKEKTEPSVQVQVQLGVARIREKRKEYPAAVQEYRKSESTAEAAPPSPSVQVLVQKKIVPRRRFLDENIARSPEGLSLYTDAEWLAGAGRPSDAEGKLNELIAKHPDFPAMDRAMVLLAKVLDQQGRCPEAFSVMEDAQKRFPKSEAVAQYRNERRVLMELDQLKVRKAK